MAKKAEQLKMPLVTLGSDSKAATAVVPACFLVEVSPLLLAQAVHTLNKRVRIRRAHTKERAEVRGGGRKPWKQKGTGRSRHGSTRSPIWVGGGTTFGPRTRQERVLAMPRTMSRRALAGSMAEAARSGKLTLVKLPEEMPAKTKDWAQMMPEDKRGLLIVVPQAKAKQCQRVTGNVTGVTVAAAERVNVMQVLKARQVWVEEDAMSLLEKRCQTKAVKQVKE